MKMLYMDLVWILIELIILKQKVVNAATNFRRRLTIVAKEWICVVLVALYSRFAMTKTSESVVLPFMFADQMYEFPLRVCTRCVQRRARLRPASQAYNYVSKGADRKMAALMTFTAKSDSSSFLVFKKGLLRRRRFDGKHWCQRRAIKASSRDYCATEARGNL